VLSLLSLLRDSRRLDRRLNKDVLTSARRADVSLLASPRTRAGATVEISWETRPRAACLELGCRDTLPPLIKRLPDGRKQLNNGYNQSRLGVTYKQSHHTVIHSKQLDSRRRPIAKIQ